MKKTVKLLLSCAIVLIAFCTVTAFADSVPALTVSCEENCKAGEQLTVTVKLSNAQDYCGISFGLIYDNEKFSVSSATVGTEFSGVGQINPNKNVNEVYMNYVNTVPVSINSDVLTVVFDVLNSAKGSADFCIGNLKIKDVTYSNMDCTSVGASVEIESLPDPSVTIVPQSSKVNAGDEVTVRVDLADAYDYCGISFGLVYDNSVFEYVSSGFGTGFVGVGQINPQKTENQVYMNYAVGESRSVNGNVITVVFRAKEHLNKNAEFDIFDLKLKNSSYENIYCVGKSATVTVECRHSDAVWTQVTAASCTVAGKEKISCPCGFSQTREIPVIAHSYTAQVIAPTKAEDGYTRHTCSMCGAYYDDTFVDALGYSIVYDSNGGSFDVLSGNKKHGEAFILTDQLPYRRGYTFVGWSVNKDSDIAEYAAGGVYTSNEDAVLYAVWKINSYYVIYYVDGDEYYRQSVVYGAVINPIAEPDMEGYSFSGWSEIPQLMSDFDVIVNGSFTFIETEDSVVCQNGVIYGLDSQLSYQYAVYSINGIDDSSWTDIPEGSTSCKPNSAGIILLRYADGDSYSEIERLYVRGNSCDNIIHLTQSSTNKGETIYVPDIVSTDTWETQFNVGKWTGRAISHNLAYYYNFDPLCLGTVLMPLGTSGYDNYTDSEYVVNEVLGKVHVTYEYTPDEVIPMSCFESFTYKTAARQTGYQITSGTLYTELTLWVLSSEGVLEPRKAYKPTEFAFTPHQVTFTVDDFDDVSGYIVALEIRPYAKGSDDLSFYVDPSKKYNQDYNVYLVEDGYKATVPPAGKYEIGVTNDGILVGLRSSITYTYAPYNALTNTLGDAQRVTDDTVLEAGVWAVSDGIYEWYVFVENAESGCLTFWDSDSNAPYDRSVLIGSAGGYKPGQWSKSSTSAIGGSLYFTPDSSGDVHSIKIGISKSLIAKYLNVSEIYYGFTSQQVIPANWLDSWDILGLTLPLNVYSHGYSAADIKSQITFYVQVPGNDEITEFTVSVTGHESGALSVKAPKRMSSSNGYIVGLRLALWADTDNGIYTATDRYVYAFLNMNAGVNKLSYTAEYAGDDQLLGDIDLDEDVDVDDAVLLFNHSMLPEEYPIDYLRGIDINKDGKVDINDAVALFNYSMLPDVYPLT